MIQDLNHFHLQTNLCSNCCPATSHFIDSKPAIDKMIEQSVTFTWNKESLKVDPQPDLLMPLFEPINVELQPKISRPRGTISTQRFHTDIENRAQFRQIALSSTLSLIKSLNNRPESVKEIKYKIKQDIDQGALISLDDFLELKLVRDQGINRTNISQYITASSLLLVYNAHSRSSPIRLCADPSRKD